MIRTALTFLPAIAWLFAAAAMGWLVWTIGWESKDIGFLEYGFMIAALIGMGWCVVMAHREGKAAHEAHQNDTAYWVPKEPEAKVIGAHAGNRYPMTEAQIAHVKSVLTALSDAGLIQEGLDTEVALIASMENEGYGDDIAAYETLLSLRDLYREYDVTFQSMVFTEEQSEVFDEQLKHLTRDLLALIGHRVEVNDITLNRQEGSHSNGSILINLDNVEHKIDCDYSLKYTPRGLIEGIAALLPESNDDRLYWENLDSALFVVRLTSAQASAFNRHMESIDDPLRVDLV